MEFPFDRKQGLIIVLAEVTGPAATAVLRLALDTGATGTLIGVGLLVALGYDPALVATRRQITTGSGVEFVPELAVTKIVALGHERLNLPVLAHTLPPGVSVDGLLGLDFLREKLLSVDFRRGLLALV